MKTNPFNPKLYLLLIILCSWGGLSAQKPYVLKKWDPLLESWRWRHIQELDNQQIITIYEDKIGNMWFGTISGLIKYDGYHYTSYSYPKDKSIGPATNIKATSLGMCIGTSKGVNILNDGKWSNIFLHKNSTAKKYDIKRTFFKYFHEISDSIVIVCSNQGLLLLTPNEKQFYVLPSVIEKMKNVHPHLTFLTLPTADSETKIMDVKWIQQTDKDKFTAWCFNGKNFLKVSYKLHPKKKIKLQYINSSAIKVPYNTQHKIKFLEAANGDIWISSVKAKYPMLQIKGDKVFSHYIGENYDGDNTSTDMVQTDDGSILCGGLGCIYKISGKDIVRYNFPDVPLTTDARINIYQDSRGNIWTINHRTQLHFIEYRDKQWHTFPDLFFQFENHLKEKWFISRDNKVVYENKGKWYYYDTNDGLMNYPSRIIQTRKGHIWAAGSQNGKAATAYMKNGKWHKQLHNFSQSIDKRGVFEDSRENIWFSSYQDLEFRGPGVLKLRYNHLDTLHWERYTSPKYVMGGFLEHKNSVYGASIDGVFKVNKKGNAPAMRQFGTPVHALERYYDGTLWVGTSLKGIYKMLDFKEIERITIDNYLKSNSILDIVATRDSGLWVATSADISYFDGKTWTNNCFPDEFCLTNEGGEINVTNDGIIWVSVLNKAWSRQAFLSKKNLKIQGDFYTVNYRKDTNPPETFVEYALDTISQEGNAYISWYGIDYMSKTPSDNLLYSYKLDNENWSPYAKDRSKTFTSLSKGMHTLLVKSRDSDSNIDETPASIKFIVLPPIWQRFWFITMVCMFILVIIMQWLRIMRRNKKLVSLNSKLETANTLLEEQKEEIITKNEEIIRNRDEIHNAKLKFFTNISHEFRTPLTLITSPIQSIIDSNFEAKTVRKYIPLIQTQSKMLLSLVKDIMDFRKLQTGNEKLVIKGFEIITLLEEVITSFQAKANKKSIQLTSYYNIDSVHITNDKFKVQRILNNLISNAINYSPENGKVEIILTDNKPPQIFEHKANICPNNTNEDALYIIVQDNGPGIPDKALKVIFERFYRGNNMGNFGSGIGLALTKNLILLLQGGLMIESEVGVGTRFVLNLPFTYDSTKLSEESNKEAPIIHNMNNPPPILTPNKDIHILVAEDESTLNNYITEQLDRYYSIEGLYNGTDAWTRINKQPVNILISDVMMPGMNGVELCQKVKSDFNTSHIPVILLTAKSEIENQIEGYQNGADLYIPKPFDINLLLAQIQSLVENRIRLMKCLNQELSIPEQYIQNNREKEFMRKLIMYIKDNIDNSTYKLGALSSDLGMTEKSLNTKIKALTGKTPGGFLRNYRLNYAFELLKKTDMSMNEISDAAGFSSPSHFSNLFKKKFGSSPGDHSKSN